MKRIISVLALICVLVASFGCGNAVAKNATGKKISVVTTIFPVYDYIKNIVGEDNENVEVKYLLDKGIDMHNYNPSADDIIKIKTSNLFIYVGGESDEWVNDVIEDSQSKGLKAINLLSALGEAVKEEEIVEGMQAEEEHDHEGEEHEGEEHEEHEGEEEEEVEYDEHVWLSLRHAEKIVDIICDGLCEIDADDADKYKANAKSYNEKLDNLDKTFDDKISNISNKVLLFADRFPFRYLVDDYDLKYYAAFVGCSAETEASFETMVFLTQKVDELNLKYIMTLEGNDKKLANTIISSSKAKDAKVLSVDSMQTVNKDAYTNGVNYYDIMKNNLNTIYEALGGKE